jgi:hypothetical protein
MLFASVVAAQNQTWGAAVNGFALSLSAPKATFSSREPIIIAMHTRNAQAATLTYGDDCQEPLVNKLVLTTADGKQIRSKPPGYFSCGYSAAQDKGRQLQSGAEFTVQYDLHKSFPTLPNGVLSFQAFRDAGYSRNGTLRYVMSNVLQITIVP